MELNSKQTEAKNKIDGSLLIIAGAGSGKTATLAARVEYMIKEKNIQSSSIMMVTFTNKAAKEMRERVANVLGVNTPKNIYIGGDFPLIGTFHSIGILFLKQSLNQSNIYYDEISKEIKLKKDFVIYDEQDKLSILKGIMKNNLNLDEKEYPSRQIAFYISNAKNSLITAKQYEKEIDSQLKEIVWSVYLKYEENLEKNNAMDFDDILIKTHNLLKIPKILEHYQEKYKYLMIDEYQDTNKIQYNIVNLLAKKYGNLAVVGDDSQSIYSWRGADMNNIINFKKDYPNTLKIKLEQNYRSTKCILKGANSVILNNKIGLKKELWTNNCEGEKINYIKAPDDKTEASIIVNIIKEKNGNLKDNLILYRTNAQSRQIEEALMMNAVSYRVIGGQKFYDRKEIKDLLAYLKIIHNFNDYVSFKRIINIPKRKIGATSIEILDRYRENYGLSYYEIISNYEEIGELKPQAKLGVKNFSLLLEELFNFSKNNEVSKLIEKVIYLTNYEDYICEGLSNDEKISKSENIKELITVASEYNGLEPRESLSQFLEEVALITDLENKDNSNDYVTLMTIHTAKGLEEKRVFICGLEDGIFPSFRSINENYALEEERRLMYVAMTRAKEELYISRAIERFQYGDYVRNPESRFISEIPSDLIVDYDLSYLINTGKQFFDLNNKIPSYKHQEKVISKYQKIENNIEDFNIGDRISHHKFGNGIITSLNGELAEIGFSGIGIKKMNIKIAPVKKIV